MRRPGLVIPIIALSVMLFSSDVFAAVGFRQVAGSVTDGEFRPLDALQTAPIHGSLLVTFIESGLGSNEGTNYLVTANATATYVCMNNGSNNPNAANKTTLSGPVSNTGTATADKNGKVTGAVPVAPLGPGDFSCPPGQTVFLLTITYSNVVLMDTTNGVSYSLPGTFSRSF